ncbi:MAG: phosphoadenosine phosphosulfate reductase family protein [Clostridia bacterium]|nr:phosphoadenosine phosphosulfate reductase family protein [Clostridia bacterium]
MTEELQKKVDFDIRLIQSAGKKASEHGQPLEICYSGGKDSDVILHLAKLSGVWFRAIYKNTTIDPPGTIAHAISNGVEILRPSRSFFKIIERNGFPNRLKRFCCGYLKEFKVLDTAVMGVRRSESTKRAKLYTEPTQCRFYGSKKNHVEAFYPILEWTNEDVAEYIEHEHIQCHPLYYDEDGVFHVERRLGCMCCPLAYKPKRIEQFKQRPNMVKAYLRAGQRFVDTHPKVLEKYPDVYALFVRDVFYPDIPKKWEELNSGLFEKPDYKKFIEDYFNIKL